MTHADLVQRAARWLEKSQRCTVVLTECGAYHSHQIPDALGWTANGRSILVECKVSINDFYADRRKRRRPTWRPIGVHRYLMTPPGLLYVELLPPHWGLLEVYPNRVRKVKSATDAPDADRVEELRLVLAETRRVAQGQRKQYDTVGLKHFKPLENGFLLDTSGLG